MDFFAAQARARRLSRALLAWFALAVAGIALAIYLAVVLAFGDGGPLWRPGLLLLTLFATGLVIVGGALYRIAELAAGGGAAVAASLGGRRLAGDASDPAERRLQNVVEEMAIAAGLPVPAIYVLDGEAAINAFAAGMAPQQAVVAVTRGALEQFTRDELQGVVGHEFSHILNGDMRLNMRLVGLLHGLMLLAQGGRLLLRSARGGRRGAGPLVLVGVALVVAGWLGVLFGRLIQAAVSRQREFLADASAVQFTRNPQGIADALRRIEQAGSRLDSVRSEEVAHMLFGAGGGPSSWLATHPPIGERLRRLVGARALAEAMAAAAVLRQARPLARAAGSGGTGASLPERLPAREATASGFAGAPAEDASTAGSGDDRRSVRADVARERIAAPFDGGGTPVAEVAAPAVLSPAVARAAAEPIDHAHLVAAREALAAIPLPVRSALQDGDGARAALLALLLAGDTGVRTRQLERLPPAEKQRVERLAAQLPGAGSALRMVVLDLALGTLQSLDRFAREALVADVERSVDADGRIVLAEYLLLRALRDALLPPAPATLSATPAELREAVHRLLSFFAHAGQADAAAAAGAHAQGAARAPLDGIPPVPLPREALRIEMLEAAFARFAGAAPGFRVRLVDALAAVVAYDRRITAPEAELLRVAAGALGVPLAIPSATGVARSATGADSGAPFGAMVAVGDGGRGVGPDEERQGWSGTPAAGTVALATPAAAAGAGDTVGSDVADGTTFAGPVPAAASGWPSRDGLPLAALVLANLLPIPGVLFFGWDVAGLLLFYWLENLVVGFFTALRMLRADGASALGTVLFFSFHYGAFCGVHGVFLMTFLNIGGGVFPAGGAVLPAGGEAWWGPLVFVQLLFGALAVAAEAAPSFFWLPLLGLFLSHGFSWYAHHVAGDEDRGRAAGKIMFDPYPRMVALHVAIIAGGMAIMALGSAAPMLLILIAIKIGVDIGLHRRAHAGRAAQRARAAAAAH